MTITSHNYIWINSKLCLDRLTGYRQYVLSHRTDEEGGRMLNTQYERSMRSFSRRKILDRTRRL